MIDKVTQAFRLKRMPFSKEIPARDLFPSQALEAGVAVLTAALENEDAALVTGHAGSGKSCLLRRFFADLDAKQHRLIYLSAESRKPGDIAKQVLADLGRSVPFSGNRAIRELKKVVTGLNTERGTKPILVLDEAQELDIATLAGLKTFINYEMDSRNFLFLLLCGQPELEAALRAAPLESLSRRLRIRFRTSALTLEETAKYIRHQLKTAGREATLFSDEAVSRVFDYSRGLISQVNDICFKAILKAAADGRELVEPTLVEGAREG